jgi:hypothetical protein
MKRRSDRLDSDFGPEKKLQLSLDEGIRLPRDSPETTPPTRRGPGRRRGTVSKAAAATITASLERLRSYLDDPQKSKTFKGLKYKENRYKIDDAIFISNEDDPNNDFIAKLLNIHLVTLDNESKRISVILEVQW